MTDDEIVEEIRQRSLAEIKRRRQAHNASTRRYKQRNRAKLKRARHKWRQENPEKVRAQNRRYYLRRRERRYICLE